MQQSTEKKWQGWFYKENEKQALYHRVAEADMSTAKEWSSKAEKGGVSTEEIFKLPPWALNTIVVRLNSGGLMLFAPVKIQEEMAEWLAERGTVQWVVLPRFVRLPNCLLITKSFTVLHTLSPCPTWSRGFPTPRLLDRNRPRPS